MKQQATAPVTLLPIRTLPTAQEAKKMGDETLQYTIAWRQFRAEILGLIALTLVMVCNAIMSRVERMIYVGTSALLVLVAAAVVVVALRFRQFWPSPHVSNYTVNKEAFHASMKKLSTRVSSGTKLSQLSCSVWKKDRSTTACKLSTSEPFLSLKLVEQLSLVDVTKVIEYSMTCNQQGSNHATNETDEATTTAAPSSSSTSSSFSSSALQQVLYTIQVAVSELRGPLVAMAPEGLDALYICAALRVFAEWRVLRQVPVARRAAAAGKGYEVGMVLGRRDLIQNLAKVERAALEWMEAHHGFQDSTTMPKHSPSLQQLLQYEVASNVHSNQLPKLCNESAAMGLLWAKRQVDYQASIYRNLVQDGGDARAAVKAAYRQVFHDYHGWWVQQVFSQSFRSAPPAREIYKLMTATATATTTGSTTTKTTTVDASDKSTAAAAAVAGYEEFSSESTSVPSWSESSVSSFDDSNHLQDTTSSLQEEDDICEDVVDLVSPTTDEPAVECNMFGLEFWDKTTKHIQGEWDKLIESTLAFFQPQHGRQRQRSPQHHQARLTTLAIQQHDSRSSFLEGGTKKAHAPSSTLEMMLRGHSRRQDDDNDDSCKRIAHEQFQVFLATVEPLLETLTNLLNKHNMNDPTKV